MSCRKSRKYSAWARAARSASPLSTSLSADEGAGGVEQAIAQPPLRGRGRDQRFRQQVRDRLDRFGLADALAGCDGKRGLQRERADEHRQSAQRRAFGGRQQVVAPGERGTQRLVPRDRGAPPPPQQREAAVEQRGGAGNAIGIDAPGGELDRERDAVQPPADLGDERRVLLAEFEFAQALGNAFHEELACRIGKDIGDAEPVALRRTIQRKQPVDALAFGTKGLAAGGENMQLGRLVNDALGQRRELVDDVLAAVEDQQHPPAAQERQQARHRVFGIDGQAERGGDGAGNEPGIRQRAEIDEAHLAVEGLRARDARRRARPRSCRCRRGRRW